MLSPTQFLAGRASDAEGLTLLLPRGDVDDLILISTVNERKMAILLDPAQDFQAFQCNTADAWKGILIPDVQVEVDEMSAFDLERNYAPYGALVRERDQLSVAAAAIDGHNIRRQQRIPLVNGLRMGADGVTAGFLRWRIVLYEGIKERIVKDFAVESAKGPPR